MVPDRDLASRSESVQWGDAREDSSSKTGRRAPKRVQIPPMSAVIPMYGNAGAGKAGTLTEEPEPGSHHRPAIARPENHLPIVSWALRNPLRILGTTAFLRGCVAHHVIIRTLRSQSTEPQK